MSLSVGIGPLYVDGVYVGNAIRCNSTAEFITPVSRLYTMIVAPADSIYIPFGQILCWRIHKNQSFRKICLDGVYGMATKGVTQKNATSITVQFRHYMKYPGVCCKDVGLQESARGFVCLGCNQIVTPLDDRMEIS
jgi:hypothetical protein